MAHRGYSDAFYAEQADRSRRSAAVVVPVVVNLLGEVGSALDVGCGVGTWLAEFATHGTDPVVGVDGGYVDPGRLHIKAEQFRAHDLMEPLHLDERFDLVVSLEVAEHLPPSKADAFVETLTRHGDVILFSAAVPGQGGTGHVNEQWPSYWITKFAAHGYLPFDHVRPRIWNDERIDAWYRQNIMLYARGPMRERLSHAEMIPLVDVAHPDAWAKRRLPPIERFVFETLPPGIRQPLMGAAHSLMRRPKAVS